MALSALPARDILHSRERAHLWQRTGVTHRFLCLAWARAAAELSVWARSGCRHPAQARQPPGPSGRWHAVSARHPLSSFSQTGGHSGDSHPVISEGTNNIQDPASLPLTSSQKDTGCCSCPPPNRLRAKSLQEPGSCPLSPAPWRTARARKGLSVSELVCLPPSSIPRGPGRAPGCAGRSLHRGEPETRCRCRLGCQSWVLGGVCASARVGARNLTTCPLGRTCHPDTCGSCCDPAPIQTHGRELGQSLKRPRECSQVSGLRFRRNPSGSQLWC